MKLLPCVFSSVYQKILHNLTKNLSDSRLSLPGFFLPKSWKNNIRFLWITLHAPQVRFMFSIRKMLHVPQVRFIKSSWSVFFCLAELNGSVYKQGSAGDGTEETECTERTNGTEGLGWKSVNRDGDSVFWNLPGSIILWGDEVRQAEQNIITMEGLTIWR